MLFQSMSKTLIIKTGAAGDVVRTSCLLNYLDGEIFWVTSELNKKILNEKHRGLHIFSLDEALQNLAGEKFTSVISLEEDERCAKFASSFHGADVIGIYYEDCVLKYSQTSSSWFDMSRISILGIDKADKLKAENTRTWQEHLFSMLNAEFRGERYSIYKGLPKNDERILVGLEKRAGERWPNKQWSGFDALRQMLELEGIQTLEFHQHETIREYLDQINRCSHIVCGDTFAMHVAMAYEKKCVAIFNCTSPWEIFDYGLLKKIVSPMLRENFYSTNHDPRVVSSIPVDEVYTALRSMFDE